LTNITQGGREETNKGNGGEKKRNVTKRGSWLRTSGLKLIKVLIREIEIVVGVGQLKPRGLMGISPSGGCGGKDFQWRNLKKNR